MVPQDDWSIVSKITVAALTSQGTMGGLLVGGLLLKTVGWRVILVTAGVYGGLYCYERLVLVMLFKNWQKCVKNDRKWKK